MTRVQSDGVKIEINPAALDMKTIQIRNHDDHTREVVRGFGIANQSRVIRLVKAQVAIALQGRILPANAVHTGNEAL